MPISTMSAQEYQSTIDRINQQNRSVEDRLADEERLKKELRKANRTQRKLNRRSAKSAATNAIRQTGWTGPVLVLLNEKGEQIGYCQDGQMYMKSPNAPRALPQQRVSSQQVRSIPAPVASQNVKRKWTLSDCVVEEVPIGNGLKGFDVYITRGGHTRTMRVYPQDRANYEECRRAIEAGNSPVANMWEDGRGGIVCWDNAVPIGGPRVSGKGKPAKKKSSKPAQSASANRKSGGKGKSKSGNSKPKGSSSSKSCNTKSCNARSTSGRTSCSNGRCSASKNKPKGNQCIKRKGSEGKSKATSTQASKSRKGKR